MHNGIAQSKESYLELDKKYIQQNPTETTALNRNRFHSSSSHLNDNDEQNPNLCGSCSIL